jgi:hypothetical protein
MHAENADWVILTSRHYQVEKKRKNDNHADLGGAKFLM